MARTLRRAVVTVVTRNHWHRALVLMASVARRVPDAHCAVVLVDRDVDGVLACTAPPFELIELATLLGGEFDAACRRYLPFELAVSAKPWALRAMLARGCDDVLYLDADMLVLDSLEPVFAALADAPVLLTPHRLQPRDDDADIELLVLRAGLYNAGFVGVSAGAIANRFLAWWQERLREHSLVDVANGLVGDQRWLDLAPVLVDGVGLLRDQGVNVGRWNLDQRPVVRDQDGYRAGAAPLRIFHFSGLLDDPPTQRSRCDETGAALAPAVVEIVASYRADLAAAGMAQWSRLPFAGPRTTRRATRERATLPSWVRSVARAVTTPRWRRQMRDRWQRRAAR